MLPFMSSSGLSPGSREAEVQRARVCLNCMEPIGLIGHSGSHTRRLVKNDDEQMQLCQKKVESFCFQRHERKEIHQNSKSGSQDPRLGVTLSG